MARLTPISVPSGVDVTISGQNVNIKGSKGSLAQEVHPAVVGGRPGPARLAGGLPALESLPWSDSVDNAPDE